MDDQISRSLEDLERLVTSQDIAPGNQEFFGKCFSLPGNPFPPGGIADPTGENIPLDVYVFDRIIRFIRETYSSRHRDFMVIRGDYGTGKTHTLRFIERVINRMMNKGDRAARAVYVERPRIEAQELNRAILRSLGFDTVRKYIWFALQDNFVREITKESEQFKDLRKRLVQQQSAPRGRRPSTRSLWSDEQLSQMTPFNDVFSREKVIDYRTFLETLDQSGWSREDVRFFLVHLLLRSIGGNYPTDLAEMFIALLLAADEASFGSWETLVGITNTKARSTMRAPDFLGFLLRLMQSNGIAYVYLLLDEFEEVSQGRLLTARQRQDYLYTIREVLNSVHEGLSIVMAISPAGWDAIVNIATPLADVNEGPIDLSRITLGQAAALVQFYFNRERRTTQFEKETKTDPLTVEAIEYILERLPAGVQPTPRNVIQFLHNLLNYAAENQICDFDAELLSDLLADFGAAKSGGGRLSPGRNVR